ncbi:hypothetical protein [Novosphingobium resinovorum]|uniref:hypothetical protein n=1 Tax=Novosphingobium resinovorum TaxID=158500 RepID=UPI003D2CF9E8
MAHLLRQGQQCGVVRPGGAAHLRPAFPGARGDPRADRGEADARARIAASSQTCAKRAAASPEWNRASTGSANASISAGGVGRASLA